MTYIPNTATAGDGSGGSVTMNTLNGVISCGTLTNAAVTAFAVTLTNSKILSTSTITPTIQYAGTLVTAGIPIVQIASISTGSCVFNVLNIGLVNALSGIVKIHFKVA